MNNAQIEQELRDLNDHSARQQLLIEDLLRTTQLIEERSLPASVAQVTHTMSGVQQILSDLAGTVHKLALEIASMTDRLTLIERTIDNDPPIEPQIPSS